MANTEVLPSFFKSEKVLSFWFSVVQREGAYYDSPPLCWSLVTGQSAFSLTLPRV